MMKKWWSIILCVVLFCSMFPFSAVGVSAASSGYSGDCTWSMTWTNDLTISGYGQMGTATWPYDIFSVTINYGVTNICNYAFSSRSQLKSASIPSSVTTIGKYAFSYCRQLSSVTIPNGVALIGDYAFTECAALTTITIPASVTHIGEGAFSGCSSLTAINVDVNNPYYSSVNGVLFDKQKGTLIQYPAGKSGAYTIPSSVTTIADNAFYWCANLSSVTIPGTVTSIGAGAFERCHALTSVTIPDSVTTIDVGAFSCCSALTSIEVNYNNPYYSSTDGVLYNKNKTTLVQYPVGKSGNYTIPNGVTVIGDYAFDSADITSVALPNSVIIIGDYAFDSCLDLKSFTMGDNVTSIGAGAFNWCDSLSSITLSANVNFIGSYAFSDCNSLKDVHYDNTETQRMRITIENGNSDLTNATWHYLPTMPSEVWYTISNGEVTILDCNFALSGEFRIPSKVDGYPVTTIANDAFNACSNLTKIIIPDTVTSIGDGVFVGCDALTSIVFGDGLTSLGSMSFVYCYNLTDVDFGNGITTIGDYAFYGCTGLTNINLPINIQIIGNYAFYGCSNLETVHYDGSRSDRNNMYIASYNTELTNAIWNYAGCDHYYYSSITTAATCISNGIRTYTCYYCSDSYTEIIYATGDHTYTNVCDEYCNVCGSWRSAPHTYSSACDPMCDLCYFWRDVNVSHTYDNTCDTVCNFCGLWRQTYHVYTNNCDATCNVCGNIRTISHSYTSVTVAPTCGYGGYTTYTCLICGDSYISDETSALGHTYTNACDTNCNVCDAVREVDDHIYDSAIAAEPTCGADGMLVYTCSICGDSYTTSIPATGEHSYSHRYDSDCDLCGAIRDVYIPVPGDANNDGKVNARDLGLFQQYINGWDVDVVTDSADVNGDGKLNIHDLGLLQRYINGWDVELQLPL